MQSPSFFKKEGHLFESTPHILEKLESKISQDQKDSNNNE